MNQILNNTLDLQNSSHEEIISELVDAVEIFRKTSPKIERYPFGFVRLSFQHQKDTDGMALHIWQDDFNEQEVLHSHRFDMQSRVLHGEIINRIWKTDPTEENAHYRKVTIAPSPAERFLKDEPDELEPSLSELSAHSVSANPYYELAGGLVHSSESKHGTITLIRRSNFNLAEPGVLFISKDDSRNIPIRVEEERIWDTIDSALKQLQVNSDA